MTRTVSALGLTLMLVPHASAQDAPPEGVPASVCAAVARPAVDLPDGVDPEDFSSTLQQGLVDALVSRGVSARPLGAADAAAADATDCPTRVTTRLAVKRKGGASWMRRVLTDAAVATVWQAPVRGLAGAAATAAAGSGLQALSAAGANSKAHDDVRFTYVATTSGKDVTREASAHATVKSDGDDVFTPIVDAAATAIAAALKKSAGGKP